MFIARHDSEPSQLEYDSSSHFILRMFCLTERQIGSALFVEIWKKNAYLQKEYFYHDIKASPSWLISFQHWLSNHDRDVDEVRESEDEGEMYASITAVIIYVTLSIYKKESCVREKKSPNGKTQ